MKEDLEELIRLQSRDGTDTKIVRIGRKGSKLYHLITEGTLRLGFRDEKQEEVVFIDPSGGPCINVGGQLMGKTVKKIYKTGVIEFE